MADRGPELSDILPVGILHCDASGRILYANPAQARRLGVAAEHLVGQHIADAVGEEACPDVRTNVDRVLKGQAVEFDTVVHYPSLGRWVVHCSYAPQRDADDRVVGFAAAVVDVTAAPRREASLRESERCLTGDLAAARRLQENEQRRSVALGAADTGTWLWRIPEDEFLVDDNMRRLMELSPGAPDRTLDAFLLGVHDDDRQRFRSHAERSLAEGSEMTVEFRVASTRSPERWLRSWGKGFADGGERPTVMAGACVEITDRKHMEEALVRSRERLEQRVLHGEAELLRTARELRAEMGRRVVAEEALHRQSGKLRALAAEITLVEQRERRRLAKVLHDHLQQAIIAARFHLAAACGERGAREGDSLCRADELLGEAMQISRSLAAELAPPILQAEGLAGAFRWLAEWMEDRHGFEVDLIHDEDRFPSLPDHVAILLFESARELLLNVVKHAHVSAARLELGVTADRFVRVTVSDCGHGFDAALRAEPGIARGSGLIGIQERLELVGGSATVESSAGSGTRVTLSCPLRHPK